LDVEDDAIDKLWLDLEQRAPTVFAVIKELAINPRIARNKRKTEDVAIAAAVSGMATLLNIRSQKNSGMQKIVSLSLCLGHADKSVFEVLDSLGLGVSHSHLSQLLKERDTLTWLKQVSRSSSPSVLSLAALTYYV
jgi:hypothetical protein